MTSHRDSQAEEFFRGLINAYRAAPPRAGEFVYLCDLASPTQIYGVILRSNAGDRTCSVLVAHDPELDDQLIEIASAASIEDVALIAQRAAITYSYRDLPRQYVLPWATGPYTAVDQMLLAARNTPEGAASLLADGSDFKLGRSMIVQTNPPGHTLRFSFPSTRLPEPDEVLKGIAWPAPSAPAAEDPGAEAQRPLPVVNPTGAAFGLYTYPPFWIGEPPFPPTAGLIRGESLERVLYDQADEVVASGQVRGVPVFITRRGMVVTEASDRTAALPILNLILAVMSHSGLPQEGGAVQDIVELSSFDPAKGTSGSSMTVTQRNSLREPWFSRTNTNTPTSWIAVAEGAASDFLTCAAETAIDPLEARRSLRLFDAATLSARQHHTEAFIVSWSLIEDWLEHAFTDYWQSVGRSKGRIRQDARNWTAAQRLDLLLAAGTIPQGSFDLLDSLRTKRNGIVHGLENAEPEDAVRCFSGAVALLGLKTVDVGDAKEFHAR